MVGPTVEGNVASPRGEPGSPEAPVFLVGPARSGTSLLYKLLCLHPDAAFISNYVARAPWAPWLASVNRIAARAPERRHRVWFGGSGTNAYVYGERRPLADRLFPMPVEGEPVFARAGLPPDAMPAEARRSEAERRLRAAIRSVRAADGGAVLVNKRIANIYRVPALLGAFPAARFVALVRDGRAVALSLSKVDWWPSSTVVGYGGTPERWAAQGGDPWELCARNWVDELAAMERGLEVVPGGQILRLRYEDVIAAPRARLGEVRAFAGLDDSAAWDAAIDHVRFPDRNDAWLDVLDPAARATIDEIQGSVLERYGYGD
ncbi:MAG TPA: sulfotransferase [Actinomycetota bacterium]|nr:sulfotransferase [Actinomycetota bacterium]